jgi:hypothetical protein
MHFYILYKEKINNLRGKKTLMNNVIDDKNNVYKVHNSIYYGFFNSAELYSSLEENTKYKIKGYGIRISFLSMFPNIISAEKIN